MDKSNSIKDDIKRCRKLIEQQLNWDPAIVPTRREYELLSEKVFEKTGVLLSISTIRRIWNNDFKNLPHKSTLDALAVFVGFKSWQNFIELQVKLDIQIRKKGSFTRTLFIGILLIAGITAAVFIFIANKQSVIEIAGPIVFDYSQESNSTIPNIIVFNYDVRNIVADSFYIVESSHDYSKKRINLNKGRMTSSYFQPGSYEAFLMADDSVVRKLDINIMSNSWVGMIKYEQKPDDVPYYFYEDEIVHDGVINVTRKMIMNNKININNDLFLTLSNTFSGELLPDNDFIFETRIKLYSIENNISCPKMRIGLLFENDICYIPLVHFGGQNKLQVKYGKSYLTSNDSDLSGFGCNIYSWQIVKIVSSGSKKEIILNDRIIATTIDSTHMGYFNGFSFLFDGIGSVDYVSMIDNTGDTVYQDLFNERDF